MAAIYSPLPPAVPRFLVVDDEAEIVCPDVYIFDFRTPHRTGADLLDLVKQRNPKIEVIFLTQDDRLTRRFDEARSFRLRVSTPPGATGHGKDKSAQRSFN